MKQVPDRNEQFENIAALVAEFEPTPNPIISIDTKKKEYLAISIGPGSSTPWLNGRPMITTSQLCPRRDYSARDL